MISHILTILIFTSAAFGAPHPYKEPQAQLPLRGEFIHFVKERIYHVIDSSDDAPPKYMMIYVTLTDCHENRTSHRIISGHVQTTWEEETCGTEYMQKWCQENPGNLITVTTGVKKMNTSAMAQFRCKMSEADDEQSIIVENIETEWMKRIVPLMIVVFILAVIYNFRRACKEQEEKGKLANAIKIVVDNSMDTITLDFSQKIVWTVAVLMVYLVCCQVPLFGIMSTESSDPLYWLTLNNSFHNHFNWMDMQSVDSVQEHEHRSRTCPGDDTSGNEASGDVIPPEANDRNMEFEQTTEIQQDDPCEDFIRRIDDLELHLNDLKMDKERMAREISDLTHKINEYKEQIEDTSSRNRDLENKNSELKVANRVKVEEVAILKRDIERLRTVSMWKFGADASWMITVGTVMMSTPIFWGSFVICIFMFSVTFVKTFF